MDRSDEHSETVGELVKRCREERWWYQNDTAQRLMISTRYLQYIEAGERVPGPMTMYQIGKVFDIPDWRLREALEASRAERRRRKQEQ
ncbi:MAG: helix-turn-helix transcriptional regulator [Armatimonadota bacterium]